MVFLERNYFFSSCGSVGFRGSSFGSVFSAASLSASFTVDCASVLERGFSAVFSVGVICSIFPVLSAEIVASGVITCIAGSTPGRLIMTVFLGSSFPVITSVTLVVIVLEVVSIMRGAHFSPACDCMLDIFRLFVS